MTFDNRLIEAVEWSNELLLHLLRGPIAQAAMWPDFVVIDAPPLDDPLSVGHVEEPMLVEALVAESPVEALHDRVLHRLARLDEASSNAVLVRPLIQSPTRQLWPIVQHDLGRQPPFVDDLLQDPHDRCTRQ